MSKMNNRPRLGRGLSSLLSIPDPDELTPVGGVQPPIVGAASPSRSDSQASSAGQVVELGVDQIHANPNQPRKKFNDSSLQELAASLKTTGLIQPIVVRKTVNGFELIAGERRLRAAKLAGLSTLPAVVKDVDGYTQAQMALIENIQREDLNPIDRATAYRTLIDQLGLTQSELAGRLGEDRTAIAHFLRLLDLSEPVRQLVQSGELSVGHGKLLAGVSDVARQEQLAARVVSQQLTVRNLERLLAEEPVADKPTSTSSAGSAAHLKALEKSLSGQLGMKVQVRWSPKKSKGKLIIHYTLDQFDDLKSRLGVQIEE